MFKVGFITTLSGRWPDELPTRRLKEYGEWLDTNLGNVEVVKCNYIINSPDATYQAIDELKKEDLDMLVMVYGAFTGDDISAAFAEKLGVPILLWAPYEEKWDKNDRLYANALVALTMNAASLHRLDLTYHTVYGSKEDSESADKVKNLVNAYRVIKALKNTHLGLYGYRPTAFYNCAFDEGLIRRTFGIRMEETDLKVIFDRMQQIDQEEVNKDREFVKANFEQGDIPDEHWENHSRLYLALKQAQKDFTYNYATIKCWPEMGKLKTTPCGVLGRLADAGVHIGCEGDIDAMIAGIIQNQLTSQPTFITDMINIDQADNTMTFWHCGNAAPSLHNKNHQSIMANHPLAGQGTALWGALKPGLVTVARLCNIQGKYKLFIMKGEAVDTDRHTKGVMAVVKINTPVKQAVDKIIEEGIPHHYSVVWDDVRDEMIEIAKLLNIEIIEL